MLLSLVMTHYHINVQGDTSGCSLGSVDIKANILFRYTESILKHNLDFDGNKTLRTTWRVTLYQTCQHSSDNQEQLAAHDPTAKSSLIKVDRGEILSYNGILLISCLLSVLQFITILAALYKVIHLLWDLGWLWFGCSTTLPTRTATSAKFLSTLGELGRQWNVQNQSQPTQVSEQMNHPVQVHHPRPTWCQTHRLPAIQPRSVHLPQPNRTLWVGNTDQPHLLRQIWWPPVEHHISRAPRWIHASGNQLNIQGVL